MKIILSLLPIIIALVSGYAFGKASPDSITRPLIRLISPLVWGLLFLIGFEFGEVISSASSIGFVLKTAVIFALCTTVVPCILILSARGKTQPREITQSRKFSLGLVWPPLRECLIALSMVVMGGALFVLQEHVAIGFLAMPSSNALLLLLILLVGVDLAQVKLDRRWFSRSMLTVPVLVVVGSLIGGAVAAWMTGESLKTSFALSSGYGWFTLSSVLIGDALGQTYGTMALMTDLLRELLAIVVLYALGRHDPYVSIGSAGATALDSTLPIIKQACSPDAVPLALVSGFLLTLLAPVFITFILT